jgi:dTDP-4-dehydrorhamnose reductase
MTGTGPVLLLGAGGLLGSAFGAALAGEQLVTAGRERLCGAGSADLAALIGAHAPRLVVNCAADVDAEGAENDDTVALAANSELPGHLARACAAEGIPLIQFSSTGCYGNWKTAPYREEDPLRPTTRHHRSKALGEDAVRAGGGEHLIVRLGWLYGGAPGRPRNFVWQRLVEARDTANMASDGVQRGCPTRVDDVAKQVLAAWRSGVRGTINAVAHGAATRADYVARIVAAAGLPCSVHAGPAFSRRAPVSPNETAVNARLEAHGVDIMPSWQEGIDNYVAELTGSPAWSFALKG